ncbi:GNAT family N-acetyltransferase [Microbacterium sp. NPDC019599]|uniref:GNAT family N-acetyltransferase n=1 Tax=Microbacterium sp. NPDC019599 TaxID=3154690 RepID=UPI0033D592C3
MKPAQVVRPARSTDAVAIARLIRQAKADAMPWLAVPHTLEEDEAWVAGVLLPGHDVTVMTERDTVVAVLAVSPGWVDQLYVATSEQGRGLGSRLLTVAQDADAAGLQLWTFQRNTRAREFYERHGFIETRRTDGDNEECEPDVLYRWEGRPPA